MTADNLAPVSKEGVAADHPVRRLAKGMKYPRGKAKVKIKVKGSPEQVASAMGTLSGKSFE